MSSPTFAWTVTCNVCGWTCRDVLKSTAEAQAKWHRPRCELKTQRVLEVMA